MNADQKQRIAQAVSNWRSYDLQEAETVTEDELSAMCSSMAALLQELIDAPEAEPFAVIHLDGSFVHVEFKQPIAGTGKFEVYAAPPVPSLLDDVARDAARYRWLRNPTTDPALVIDKRVGPSFWDYEYRAGDELDAAIDAAIAEVRDQS